MSTRKHGINVKYLYDNSFNIKYGYRDGQQKCIMNHRLMQLSKDEITLEIIFLGSKYCSFHLLMTSNDTECEDINEHLLSGV